MKAKHKGSNRSAWIAAAIRARKPSIAGEVLVERLEAGAYRVELRFEESEGVFRTIPVAKLEPIESGKWRLYWTSGNGLWKPLDPVARTLDEVIAAIIRDDFGCFFG